jgi:predicted secreted protein
MKMKPMLLTLFLCCPLFGQELDTKVLSGFYNKVIIDFLEGELERDTLNEQRHYVIKTDLEKTFLIKAYAVFEITYIGINEDASENVKQSLSTINGHKLLWINHSIPRSTNDTVDVDLGGWNIEVIKNKKDGKSQIELNYGAWCGGTLGAIPEGRFIYDKSRKTWISVNIDELIKNTIDKRHKEFKEKVKRINNVP